MSTISKDHKGIIYSSMREMARAYNINIHTLARRLDKGWSIEKALTTETTTRRYSHGIECEGIHGDKYYSLLDLAKAYGIPYDNFYGRKRVGRSTQQIIKQRLAFRKRKEELCQKKKQI